MYSWLFASSGSLFVYQWSRKFLSAFSQAELRQAGGESSVQVTVWFSAPVPKVLETLGNTGKYTG